MDLKRMYITKRIKEMFPRLDTTNIDEHLDEIKPVLDAIDNKNIKITVYTYKHIQNIPSYVTFEFKNLVSITYSCIDKNNLIFNINHISYRYKIYCMYRRVMINQTIRVTDLKMLEKLSKKILQKILKYEIVAVLKENLTQNQRNEIRKIVNSIIHKHNKS